MKKRIFAIVLMVVMVMCMSMTAFAADGMSGDETTLFNHFKDVLNKHSDAFQANRIAQYTAKAEEALVRVNLDSNACADLSKCVDDVDAFITAKNAHTPKDMKAIAPDIVNMVNAVANKYYMYVTVDMTTKEAKAEVTFKNPGWDVPSQDNGAGAQVIDINGNIVRQTGVDYAVTAGVLGVFAIGLASAIGFVLVQKKKVNA